MPIGIDGSTYTCQHNREGKGGTGGILAFHGWLRIPSTLPTAGYLTLPFLV